MNNQDQWKQPSVVTDQQLPLKVIVPSGDLLINSPRQSAKKLALPKYFLLAFVPLLLFTGAVVGRTR